MRMGSRLLIPVVAIGLFIIGCATSQQETTQIVGHPKFEQMCSKCHTLDRVHQAHQALSQEGMSQIVQRMAEKPDSGIDMNSIKSIVQEMY